MSYKWDLTRIEPSEEAFEKDVADIAGAGKRLSALEGKLATEEGFASYLDIQLELEEKLGRAYHYASMRSDLDKKDVDNAQALMRVRIALVGLNQEASFAEPEILKAGKPFVDSFFKKHPEYSQFDFSFEKLFRGEKFVLPTDMEKLASAYSPLLSEGSSLYSNLCVADYTPKKATLSDGREIEVNQSNWTSLIEKTEKPEDRKAIFESLYSYYDEHKNALAEVYNLVVQSQLSEKKARGYSSIAETHLYGNAIPVSVLENLINVASENSAPLRKYYEIKRKYLGLEKFRSYDRFIRLAKSNKEYSFEDAQALFFDSIKNFPADFQEKAHEVNKDGYVDVYPGPGKRTGAYSTGGGNIHPYMLLNFEGGLEDVFTLAHESGHSIHTLYASENQPIVKSGYTIFVAEIASTFNEHNLLDYLFKSGSLDKQDKIFLLQKEIDEICGTFYRQTLFAHFEYEIAKLAEAGQPINYKVLSDTMTRLYQTYYGIDITEEVYKPLVWAYIPHLYYSPFYVYQYATSFTASMLIYKNVKEGKEGAFEKYIEMLKSGGSMYPVEQVKLAGVDLTSKEPFLAVTSRMAELVDQLEELLK